MEWLRWYHGTINDAKWVLIAAKSGSNIGTVVSVWAALLEHASQRDDRGSVEGFDPEFIDALYGYPPGTCESVLLAMIHKGLIADSRIVSWNKRQPKREDPSSTERVRKYREKQKSLSETSVADCNEACVTDTCNGLETQCNAMKRNETQRNAREDKRREEKNIKDIKHMCETTSNGQETSEDFSLSDKPSRNEKRKTEYTPEFEEFWKAYPSYGRNKTGAFQKWQAALAGTGRSCRASPEQLIRAAKRYAEECREKGTEKGFVLHAATFLGPNERWKEFDRPQTCMSGALRDDVRRMDFTSEGVFDAVGFERARRGLDPYEPGRPYRPPVPGSQLGG